MFGSPCQPGLIQQRLADIEPSGTATVSILAVFKEGIYDLLSHLVTNEEALGLDHPVRRVADVKEEYQKIIRQNAIKREKKESLAMLRKFKVVVNDKTQEVHGC